MVRTSHRLRDQSNANDVPGVLVGSAPVQVCTLLVCRANGAVVGARTGREAACLEQEEYRSGSVCCQNCPAGESSPGTGPLEPERSSPVCLVAGTYVAEPCSAAGRRGTCRKCDDGTFMEHSNGLRQCFPCTACRSGNSPVGGGDAGERRNQLKFPQTRKW